MHSYPTHHEHQLFCWANPPAPCTAFSPKAEEIIPQPCSRTFWHFLSCCLCSLCAPWGIKLLIPMPGMVSGTW